MLIQKAWVQNSGLKPQPMSSSMRVGLGSGSRRLGPWSLLVMPQTGAWPTWVNMIKQFDSNWFNLTQYKKAHTNSVFPLVHKHAILVFFYWLMSLSDYWSFERVRLDLTVYGTNSGQTESHRRNVQSSFLNTGGTTPHRVNTNMACDSIEWLECCMTWHGFRIWSK